MKAKLDGNKLILEIDLISPPRPSATGKTLVVASTHGNQKTDVVINGHNVIVGLNAYIPNRAERSYGNL